MIWKKNRRLFGGGQAICIYKLAKNPLGTVPNAPLASALGKGFHPPTLIILEMHRGRVKR